MYIPQNQPAFSYDLNLLMSSLSRLRLSNSDNHHQLKEIRQTLENLVEDVFSQKKPLLFHNDPKALDHVSSQLKRMRCWLDEDHIIEHIPPALSTRIRELIDGMLDKSKRMKPKGEIRQQYFDPRKLETLFQMPGLVSQAGSVLDDEKNRFPEPLNHPPTPDYLKKTVSLPELKNLVQWSYHELFSVRQDCSAVLDIVDDAPNHHLLWTLHNDQICFVVPESFGLDILFSFEIPHTSAHLLHLEALRDTGGGTLSYIDDMPQRAFLEAVAVLSEWKMIQWLQQENCPMALIIDCLDQADRIDPAHFQHWLLMDRLFEARLRAARLLADHCTLEGLHYDDTFQELKSQLGIPSENAEREIMKYYSLTGLGAIYTMGYRRLLEAGVSEVSDAIMSPQSVPLTSWNQFSEIYEQPKTETQD